MGIAIAPIVPHVSWLQSSEYRITTTSIGTGRYSRMTLKNGVGQSLACIVDSLPLHN